MQKLKIDKKTMQLYLVTDNAWLKGKTLESQVEEAVRGGVTFVQLRNKDICSEELAAEAKNIKKITDRYKIPFVVNDDIRAALEADADGVHVGQSDMSAKDVRSLIGEAKILGVSVQSVQQALLAQKQGADYLGVGAVFPTGTKNDADDVDANTVAEICRAVNIPVVAIGGISEKNIHELCGMGLDGVAVISAILSKSDISGASVELLELSRKITEI
ncbi:MAG: thiamine phosphate synthase [Proteocatella sp.]